MKVVFKTEGTSKFKLILKNCSIIRANLFFISVSKEYIVTANISLLFSLPRNVPETKFLEILPLSSIVKLHRSRELWPNNQLIYLLIVSLKLIENRNRRKGV